MFALQLTSVLSVCCNVLLSECLYASSEANILINSNNICVYTLLLRTTFEQWHISYVIIISHDTALMNSFTVRSCW